MLTTELAHHIVAQLMDALEYRRSDTIEKLHKQPFSHHRDIYIIAILSLGIINRPFYQVTLMPNAKLALELRGMNSLLVLPKMWSIPMKKL